MPTAVIDRINVLARDQPQLVVFLDREKSEITDSEIEYTPRETLLEVPGVIRDASQIPGVDMTVDMALEVEGNMPDLGTMPNQQAPSLVYTASDMANEINFELAKMVEEVTDTAAPEQSHNQQMIHNQLQRAP
jgi:hypothetical protein